ncbi:ADP-ribosylation_factor 1 [Hexamita inflata]|uniref:ADP-ribosylation factor 1 n=1 Tax=Hexamita inflata TaxID=28002 RepID=A0AA86PIF8_9EUKA|nr:ADP-ribosylation factor 1 [Hexamita inflata]
MSLCTKCKKIQEVRVLMLGLDLSGKTSLLYQWALGELITTIPTIGLNIEQVKIKNISLNIWDVGDQERMRPLWRHYLSSIHNNVLFFVIDATERDQRVIYEIKTQLLNIFENQLKFRSIPMLILFNKSDIKNSFTNEEIEEEYDFKIGESEIKTNSVHKIKVMRTSALNSECLPEIMDWVQLITQKKKKF